jgi:hypothetical protein
MDSWEANQDMWSKPVADTTLENETAEFWHQLSLKYHSQDVADSSSVNVTVQTS